MAKKLTKTEVNGIVSGLLTQSVGWKDSKLSRERIKILDYYNAKLPKRQHLGSASYVSTDVYDAVDSMKAQLLETFASGYDIIRFNPVGPEDVEPARIATEYTRYVIFQQNNGYKILSNAIHDGLIARVGIVKHYWESHEEESEEQFENLDPMTAQALMQMEDVKEFDGTLDPETGYYSGTLTRVSKTGRVHIDNIPPEEFVISSDAVSLDAANLVAHRTLKTRAQLLEMGYPRKIVQKLPRSNKLGLNLSEETQSRFDPIGTGFGDTPQQDTSEGILVHECYLKLDMDHTGVNKLYKVVKAAEEVLEITEVDRKPFTVFCPLPVPHSFWGNNFADRVVPVQNARTTLVRSILDHASVTNNPRFQVLKGGLVNPRELLDNRLGGIVNVTRPDAVTPLMQANLNPFVYQTIELLQADKEQTTGISQLSQGLNKDAISSQNSTALVDQMVSLSQQRQKIIARNFAYNFLVPLFFEVYRLVIENEDKRRVVQIAGNWMQIDPKQWIERNDATVGFYLGYGEQEREAQKFMEMHMLLSQDPAVKDLYSIQGRYKAVTDALRAGGIKNVDDYLTPPEKAQPPEPDPMMVAEVQHKQASAQAVMIQAEAAKAKVEVNAQLEAMKQELQKMQIEIMQFKTQTDAQRKDFETVNRVDIAHRELEAAAQVDQTNKKAIYSANS